jgi:serine/threonine-protein kinase
MVACPSCAASCSESHSFCFACGTELERVSRRAEDPLIGRTLPGGYRVTHMVGVGGMGRVYCAEQVALGRTVAVKVVHPHLADDDVAAARFLNEARAASRLSHPNCVAIFDFGRTEEGQPYIVMEYVRGRDLGRIADTEGPLSLRRIVDVLRQTLAALEEAHALSIVHRDLKPDNIVLEPLRSGLDFVKVVDFGLAKMLGGEPPVSGAGGALTRPGLVCGTPEYMSPEQGRGDPLDGRSDLYALGVVLFELLAGRVPFAAENPTKTLLLHLEEPAPDPRNVAPERSIPAPFAELTRQALAKSPAARFQSAAAFSEALVHTLVAVEGRSAAQEPNPATAIRCRTCGKLNPIGKKFCGECGVSIVMSTSGRDLSGAGAFVPEVQAHAPTQVEQVSVAAEESFLPFVGRDDAIAWLETRRHEAEAMLAAAHVVGDAGSGRTRLVREFLARCADRGDLAVSVGPDPAWAKLGDAAARDAVRKLAGLSSRVGPAEYASASPDAVRGLEILFDAPGVAARTPPGPDERRRALAEALRWAIGRGSERAGTAMVVLAVDDLDFLDGTSRNAFADVLSEPPVSSALLIVTYAPTGSPAGAPLAGEIWPLQPLASEHYSHLLPTHLASPARPLAPLHIEQLIAWAREETEPPPERLADLVTRRAEHLPPDARHVLHALAVWGDDATPSALEEILPAGVDVATALDVLDRARVTAIDDRTVRIAHPLVRRVAFSNIPAGRKRELFSHAERLRPDAPLEVRAKQAMHGGSAFEALSLLDTLSARRAAHGDVAGSISALRHALDLARRELHRGELDDPVGAVLVFARKLAEALGAGEHWTDAEGVLREALGMAPPNSEHRIRLLGVLARVASARRHTQEARRYLDEAIRVARQSDAGELMPMLERIERLIAVA